MEIAKYKVEFERVWIEDDGTINYDNCFNDEYYLFEECIASSPEEIKSYVDNIKFNFDNYDIEEGIEFVNDTGRVFESRMLVDGEGLWEIITIRKYKNDYTT